MKTKHWLQGIGGLVVGSGCLWLSLRNINLDQMTNVLETISWQWVIVAFFGIILVSMCKALRWKWLYPKDATPLRWSVHFSILLVAQMFNLLVPVRLGEIARLGLMQQEERPAGMTLATIAIEKSLDLTATGLLLLLAIPVTMMPRWLRPTTGFSVFLTGATLLTVLLLLGKFEHVLSKWLKRVPRPRREPWNRWSGFLIRSLKATLKGFAGLRGKHLLPVLGCTTLIWLLSVSVIQMMLLAFGITQGWITALSLMLALTFSNLAPTPPALVGLVGVVTKAVLLPFGVSSSQALALGMLLNVVLVAPPVFMGGWAAVVRLVRMFTAPDWAGLYHALGLTPLHPQKKP